MEQRFIIRRADRQDIEGIMKVMLQVKQGMSHPEWFVADDREWVETHLDERGFTMVALADGSDIAGFFIVAFPETAQKSLGNGFLCDAQAVLTAHMDSAAVLPQYRGRHLQGRLLEAAERELDHYPQKYLFCTVHPDNHASLNTMQRYGYEVVATKMKYGGLPRHVLYKMKGTASRCPKPNILVSACLLGVNCRYNGKGELDEGIRELMAEANLIPVCPEVFGGLATPRNPAERVGERVITVRGEDVTSQYQKGAEETLALAKLFGCSCAILKERSPSCGSGVVYDGTYSKTLIKGDGMAVQMLKAQGIEVFGESERKKVREFLGLNMG